MSSSSKTSAPKRSAPPASASWSRPRVLLLVCCLISALQLASAAMALTPGPQVQSSLASATAYPLPSVGSIEAAKLASPPEQRRGLARAESAPQNGRRYAEVDSPEPFAVLGKRATAAKKKTTSSKRKTTSSKRKTTSSKKKTTSSTKRTTSSSKGKTTSSTKKVSSSTSSKKSTSTASSKTTTSTSRTTTKPTSTTTKTTTTTPASTATLSSSNLHLLVQNNLDWATLDEHPGFLLSEALSDYSTASIACAGLAETLASPGSANVDLQKQLSYLLYKGVLSSGQSIWTSDSQLLTLIGTDGSYTLSAAVSKSAQYAVLCTQSAPRKTAYTTDTSSNWDVRVKTPAGSVVTGYRDGLSFRFHAIPYASTPVRFTYSTADTSARVINATVAGTSKQCPQNSGTYTENCLVLSIWTTYLPSASANASSLINSVGISNGTNSSTNTSATDAPSSTTDTTTEASGPTDTNGAPAETATTPTDPDEGSTLESRHMLQTRATDQGLRPIMVWVHGGGNVAGTGLDPTFDGGQLASRGDVVVVNINYRLSTLGALPISDDLTGNYGLQDIVTALKWLKTNAATFGGDASSITLFGQSSGANLIQILLGNPSATGLFHKVIIQSGKPADSYNGALASDTSETKAAATLSDLGCTKSTTAATLACLRALPVSNFLSGTVYSQTTVDSKFVPQRAYALNGHGHTTNRVPVLMGFMRDEMASLGYAPPKSVVNLSTAMTNAGIVKRTRQIVLDNPDVFPKSIPNGVQNLTVQVESYNSTGSRCGIPATAYAAVRSGAFPNVWVYTQDQRSYQIPNYDPYGVCQPSTGSMAGNSSAYYFCHSGDLLSTFANPMYEFGMGDRDGEDLDWIRNVVDQWTAFAHNSDPNPTDAYRSARGYSAVQGDPWPKLSTSSGAAASRMISLGPEQVDIPLVYSPEQCDILGNGIEYIYKGGETGDDDGSD